MNKVAQGVKTVRIPTNAFNDIEDQSAKKSLSYQGPRKSLMMIAMTLFLSLVI